MVQSLLLSSSRDRQKLPSAQEMAEFDRSTILAGTAGQVLMERAGVAVYQVLQRRAFFSSQQQTVILAGPGNNGGDGFVVARQLLSAKKPFCLILAAADHYSSDLLAQIEKFSHSGGSVLCYRSEDNHQLPLGAQQVSLVEVTDRLRAAALLIDALLGTGQGGAARGSIKELIELVGDLKKSEGLAFKTVALDLPSGVDASSGAVYDPSIEADLTVTIELIKRGLLQYPARQKCGEIEAVSIEIDTSGPCHFSLLFDDTIKRLPPRAPNTHKGDYGHVLVIAGSAQMPGAAELTARAALRCGAGLVTKVLLTSAVGTVSMPEIMHAPVNDQSGFFEPGHLPQLLPYLERASCVVLGPGLGQADPTAVFVAKICDELVRRNLPTVIDADGLNCLAKQGGQLPDLSKAVLTPHPGEIARLLGVDKSLVQNDRYKAASKVAQTTGAVVVLKGAATVVCSRTNGWVSSVANPYLATAGSGDILTGLIAALIAQGLTPEQAACLAVFAHAASGEQAHQVTAGTIIATDLLQFLPGLLVCDS